MANFKFNLISTSEIIESPHWQFMLDAMRFKWDNLIVYWPPWCGKSTIAGHRLEFLKEDKKNAIYLTYSNLLKEYVKQSFKDENTIKDKINTFFSYLWFTLNDINYLEDNYQENRNACDELIQKRIQEHNYNYEEIIIDEWQDLPYWVYEKLLKKSKNISIFLDLAQSIYKKWLKNVDFNNIISYWTTFQLQINRRNPRSLYEFALQLNPEWITKSDLKLMKNVSWDTVEIYECNDWELEMKEILDIIKENKTSNIWILVWNNQSEVDRFCEKLNQTEYNWKYTKFHSNSNLNLENFQNIMVTTFKSAKWLEFDIVIIPNVNIDWWYKNGNNYIDDRLLFVAFTRAREQLIITYINWNNFVQNRIKDFDKKTYKIYERKEKEISIEDIPF